MERREGRTNELRTVEDFFRISIADQKPNEYYTQSLGNFYGTDGFNIVVQEVNCR